MQGSVCIDNLRPKEKVNARLFDIILVFGASILIALCSQISFRLYFSPVPVTGQSFAVLLIGMILGRNRGMLAVLAYLGEGMSGLPVFANGAFGLVHLTGPTGGYLLGFIPAVYATGYLAERKWSDSVVWSFLALITGTAIIFIFGLSWLQMFVGINNVLEIGLIPFLPGALLKALLVLALIPFLNGWLRRYGKGTDKFPAN